MNGKDFVPLVTQESGVKELTLRSIVLGILLSVILGAANVFLGLRVGLTVSASIPAAVVSLGILRMLGKSNPLENNQVQTAASAGESLAAGVLFTIPALLILGTWDHIQYLETIIIGGLGGILGVLFTVSLRRALIVEGELQFPEGIATAEVIKAAYSGKNAGLGALVSGGAIGAIFQFIQGGLKAFGATAVAAGKSGKALFAFGIDLSPALLGVGYIIGLEIASLVFLGGVIGWLVAIPLYSAFASDAASFFDGATLIDAAYGIWSAKVRYIGAGAMLVGGLWSLVKLRSALQSAIRGALAKHEKGGAKSRFDRDISMRVATLAILVLSIPVYILMGLLLNSFLAAILVTFLILVLGYLFSAVGAYMAGLVGSSNNPISGVTILGVVTSALLLVALGYDVEVGAAGAIFVAGIIASAGAIASDNMQDLKAGYLLGSTPRNQQIMQIVGVAAAALTIPFVLDVLTRAYELGSADLAAPQASLMAFLAQGTFTRDLPYLMLGIGAALAVGFIILDEFLGKTGAPFRTPVMAVAVGIYLPVGLSAPIFLGGLTHMGLKRYLARVDKEEAETRNRSGILMSSGLIAGASLMGILIAVLKVTETDGALDLGAESVSWSGLIAFGALIAALIHTVVRGIHGKR